jgi:hypothetical protein
MGKEKKHNKLSYFVCTILYLITQTLTQRAQGNDHRVYRVPGFLSNRPNWVLPPPRTEAIVAPPFPLGLGGRRTRWEGGD